MAERLPITVSYQIRQGVHNPVHTFDIEVFDTRVLEEGEKLNPDSVLTHEVRTMDLVRGLRAAADKMEDQAKKAAGA